MPSCARARAGDVIRLGGPPVSGSCIRAPTTRPHPAGGRHQQCVGGAACGEPQIPRAADWRCGGPVEHRCWSAACSAGSTCSRSATTAPIRARCRRCWPSCSQQSRSSPPAPTTSTATPIAVTLEHLAALPGVRIRRTDLQGTLEVIADAGGLVSGSRVPRDAGSIGPWWYPVAIRPCGCSIPWICRMGSSFIRRAWPAWRPKPRAWWRRPACRSTCAWPRSPPCSTTSTSRRRAGRRRPRSGRRRAPGRLGFEELAAPVASHPVTCLLDDRCFPRGWPSVVVAVADRHVAQAFMTIDERIDEMKVRHPAYAADLDAARRPAHALEAELSEAAGLAARRRGRAAAGGLAGRRVSNSAAVGIRRRWLWPRSGAGGFADRALAPTIGWRSCPSAARTRPPSIAPGSSPPALACSERGWPCCASHCARPVGRRRPPNG